MGMNFYASRRWKVFPHPLARKNYVPRRVYEVVRSGMNFWLPVHAEILSRYIPHSSILINDFNISKFILILHLKASDNSIKDLYVYESDFFYKESV